MSEYKCKICEGVFESDWTEEEARQEEKDTFGVNDPNGVVVCDDCYKAVMKGAQCGNYKRPAQEHI